MPLVCGINLGSDYILCVINLQLIICEERLLKSWLFLPRTKGQTVDLSSKIGVAMHTLQERSQVHFMCSTEGVWVLFIFCQKMEHFRT